MDSIKKAMRRFSMIAIMLACLWGISGCNSEQSGVPMSVIRDDVEKCDSYASMRVNTDSVEVIKRQTNAEIKEDLIYVSIKGKNEYYEITRNYKMRYLLYNDGWILEEVKEYSDAENWDVTTPLKEAFTEEDIDTYLSSVDLLGFASFSEDVSNLAYYDTLHIDKVSVDMHENYGSVLFQCELIYQYYLGFTEKVILPVECRFSTYDGSWTMKADKVGISREVTLNQWLIGSWKGAESGSIYLSTVTVVNISSYEEDRCYVEYLNTTYDESDYNEGVMLLDTYMTNNGEIGNVRLVWAQEDSNDKFAPLYLTGYLSDNSYGMTVDASWIDYQLKKQ